MQDQFQRYSILLIKYPLFTIFSNIYVSGIFLKLLTKFKKLFNSIDFEEIFKFVNKNVKSKYIYEKKLHTNFLRNANENSNKMRKNRELTTRMRRYLP